LVWKVVNYDCGLNKNIKNKSWTQRHNFLKRQVSRVSLQEYLTKKVAWIEKSWHGITNWCNPCSNKNYKLWNPNFGDEFTITLLDNKKNILKHKHMQKKIIAWWKDFIFQFHSCHNSKRNHLYCDSYPSNEFIILTSVSFLIWKLALPFCTNLTNSLISNWTCHLYYNSICNRSSKVHFQLG
jgi:hypothetical protein